MVNKAPRSPMKLAEVGSFKPALNPVCSLGNFCDTYKLNEVKGQPLPIIDIGLGRLSGFQTSIFNDKSFEKWVGRGACYVEFELPPLSEETVEQCRSVASYVEKQLCVLSKSSPSKKIGMALERMRPDQKDNLCGAFTSTETRTYFRCPWPKQGSLPTTELLTVRNDKVKTKLEKEAFLRALIMFSQLSESQKLVHAHRSLFAGSGPLNTDVFFHISILPTAVTVYDRGFKLKMALGPILHLE